MAAPAPMVRPAYSTKPLRRPIGGNSRTLPRPRLLIRPLAHLLVLSLVLAGMPPPGQPAWAGTKWVEDVGSSEIVDPAVGPSSIGVEFGPMLELGPALPAEPPVKLDRAPLKLRTYTV